MPRITKWIDQSSDGKTYTFHLQPNLTFTDGTPFDADAVMWNVERRWDQTKLGRKNPPQFESNDRCGGEELVLGPGANDQYDGSGQEHRGVRTGQAFFQFISGMPEAGSRDYGHQQPGGVEEFGTAGIATTPVGTGPFVFKSEVPGDTLIIAKNPKYWNPEHAAKADKITFKALPDAATRVAALRAGEVHVIFAPPTAGAQLR